MNTYHLKIATPDGNLLDEDVLALYVRGAAGDLAVLAGHAPFVTTVKAGECRIDTADGCERKGHTDGGILIVSKESVTLLSGTFRWED